MVASAALVSAPRAASQSVQQSLVKEIKVKDVNGVAHRLPDAKSKAMVLLFIAADCPISNGYAPEINRICNEYSRRKISFFVVYPDADLAAATARKHAREFGYRCPVLLDPTHRLVKRMGATVTPEAAVLSPGGKLLYRGRIDDRYLDFGKKRNRPGQRDLRLALDDIVKGKTVANRFTKAIGCFIPALP